MKTKSLTFSNLEDEAGEALDRMFKKKDCMILVEPSGAILPAEFRQIGEDILGVEVREDDVWMCSYPRTGSTWAQEMVWLVGHDLDYEGAKSIQQIRCPLVELSCIMVDGNLQWVNESMKGTSVDLVKHRLPHPRYVRSHLPFPLLPNDIEREDGSLKAKVIYTSRNPKDMVVSYYHYCSLVHGLTSTFEEFCELFMKDRAPIGPVWSHIFGFWSRRHDPNLLFIKFEEMKRDLPAVIRKTAKFLGKTITDDQVNTLSEHLSFQSMKKNRAVNLETLLERSFGKEYLEQTELRFIRKGEIGDWKNYMSDDLSRRFDEWAAQHIQGTGLSFD
ncbi:luciferin sulfotransferase [Ostrinia nubilalis]|uniref:luciferin sulfotransferase n=1 Tax=Ostrinia nubilalis TaxID=29057 RepID=UPI0030823945